MKPWLVVGLGLAAGVAWTRRSASGRTSRLPLPGDRLFSVGEVTGILHVPARAASRVVLYFHGHGDSPANALLQIVPSLDALPRPPIVVAFKLGPLGEYRSLGNAGVIPSVLKQIEVSGLPTDALAHSGGYLALAQIVRTSGQRIESIGLLDALYGDLDTYVAYARKSTTRHLAVIAGPSTAANAAALADRLKAPTFPAAGGTSSTLVRATRVGVWPTTVFHPLVPAAYAAPLVAGFSS